MGDDSEQRREAARRRMDEMLKRPPAYTGDTIARPNPKPADAVAPPVPQATPQGARRPGPVSVAPRRPKLRIWLLLRLALVGLLLALAASLLGLYWQALALSRVVGVRDVRPDAPFAAPLLGGVNLLLVGVDEREGAPEEGVRSDTLIVVHLNGPGSWANLLAIPRDTMAELPLPEGVAAQKINTAYGTGYARAEELYGPGTTPQQGGMALSAQTAQRFLGLPIHYTAQINFDGFARLIDAMGGITVDVPIYILDTEYPTADFGTTTVEFQPGVQRMDGATALIYARTRHADSDFDRGKRQQQVLRAMLDEFRGQSRLRQALLLPRLRDSLQGTLLTTLPIERLDVMVGAARLSGVDPAAIGQFRISPETVTLLQEDEFANLYWDAAGVREQARLLTSAPSEEREAATVQVFNGTGTAGLAGRVSNRLAASGFRLALPADPPPGDYAQTTIYARTDKPVTLKRLAAELDAAVVQGPPPEGVVSEADLVVLLGGNAQ